jgi:hypothetical protein
MDRGWSVEQIMECPIYTAMLLMGGISKDKTGLRLSDKDGAEYLAIVTKRRAEQMA